VKVLILFLIALSNQLKFLAADTFALHQLSLLCPMPTCWNHGCKTLTGDEDIQSLQDKGHHSLGATVRQGQSCRYPMVAQRTAEDSTQMTTSFVLCWHWSRSLTDKA